jgi:hypothetical protein
MEQPRSHDPRDDLQADAHNCGTCGHACGTGQICVNGACAVSGDARGHLRQRRVHRSVVGQCQLRHLRERLPLRPSRHGPILGFSGKFRSFFGKASGLAAERGAACRSLDGPCPWETLRF